MTMELLPFKQVRWLGQAVWRWEGTLENLEASLPSFTRLPMTFEHALNEYLDLIVREPMPNDDRRVPVATVSKRYALIQHTDAAAWLCAAFEKQRWDKNATPVTVWLSEYGERMRAEVNLPIEPVTVREGDVIRSRVLLLNSVDRSRAFELALQWERLVCKNGLTIWNGDRLRKVHHLDWMSSHSPVEFLAERLPRSRQLVEGVRCFVEVPVDEKKLRDWIDEVVAKEWGRPRAARLWSILKTGHDGAVGRTSNDWPASRLEVVRGDKVPGAVVPAGSAYDIYQGLLWLAGNQRSLEQREELLNSIADLMGKLLPPEQSSILSAA